MRASLIIASAAALVAPIIAAPMPGGYWNADGKWCDDGYWYYSQNGKTGTFVPWAEDYVLETGCTKPESGNQAPVAQPTNDYSSNDGSFNYFGSATYYYQGGRPGACGAVRSDSDMIIALHTDMYAGGSHCGKQVQIKNADTGATVTATVADMCPTCVSSASIDLSDACFKAIGNPDKGVLNVAWGFI